MRVIRFISHGVVQLAQHIGALMFLLLFGVFIVQIVARFIFDQPLPWSDEAAVILYVWIILWASAWMVPTREHVVFDLIWNSVSARVKRGMSIVGNLMIAGLSLVAIPASWDYVQFMGREHTPVLDWSLQWVYFPFVVLLVALSWRSVVAVIQAVQKDERSEQESRS